MENVKYIGAIVWETDCGAIRLICRPFATVERAGALIPTFSGEQQPSTLQHGLGVNPKHEPQSQLEQITGLHALDRV